MPLDRKLLEMLVCPVSKQPLFPLPHARLVKLNRAIEQGGVCTHAGEQLTAPLKEALITENGATLYQIDGGIPVMLESASIPCAQIPNW